ncbi:MAG: adenylosuccinate synthase [Oscillospiraceae bacterium]|nr:adenylosuccinate synthase [Oscillospiraceae bacterium]
MSGKVVLGAQWGDEGKGKFIDIFASEADVVVRSQGGNNAGHTVIVGENVYKLHLIPSGILYPKTMNVVGAGVVLDPKVVLAEMDELALKGAALDNLFIDERTHVIMPWHIEQDGLEESARGKGDIGTTKKGIGPCYMDKAQRVGIRMHDFISKEKFAAAVRRVGEMKNKLFVNYYGSKALDLDAIIEEYSVYAERLAPYVRDTSVMVYDAIKAGKKVLFEGAQGTLLDIDMGTYPYVTSSHPVSGGVCVGAGIGPTCIDEIVGIFKGYTTRVGKGPFPTELDDEIGEYIRQAGFEFGVTTGRARRTGWFDAVMARYAVRVNGLTSIVINKIDPLRGLDKIKLCVAYEKDGKIVNDFPADLDELAKCTPVYEEFDGFDEDISNVRKYEDFPESIKTYIEAVEKACGCPVSIIGVGPDREQIVYKN